ncbi:MAG: ACP S-malonyltransferase [Verrucomicrobia bacterium]|nr:ACP S-malonyltransferase [Verrucomicrobiota bacterium]
MPVTTRSAIVFPGQGAQHVGMAKELYDAHLVARALIDAANDVLGFDLRTLMFDGPEDELTQTKNSQPAIYVASLAAWLALAEQCPGLVPAAFAGLSLGEYTALCAAGSVRFEDGLRLVRQRGEAMQEACERSTGTMASIIGLDEAAVRKVVEEANAAGLVDVANVNCPGQIVVSGSPEGVRAACAGAKAAGAGRAIELKVSGAFHSRLMEPAREKLFTALATAEIREPRTPVIHNVSAAPATTPDAIRRHLADQCTASVLWQASIERLIADGVTTFVEAGPGTVLQGLLKRIDRSATGLGVQDAASLDRTAAALRDAHAPNA